MGKVYRVKARVWVLRWHSLGDRPYLARRAGALVPSWRATEHRTRKAAKQMRDEREQSRGCTAEAARTQGVPGGHFWRIVRRGPATPRKKAGAK